MKLEVMYYEKLRRVCTKMQSNLYIEFELMLSYLVLTRRFAVGLSLEAYRNFEEDFPGLTHSKAVCTGDREGGEDAGRLRESHPREETRKGPA